MAAAFPFLEPEAIEIIYEIYDLIYNYNYMYKLIEKKESVTKENIEQYKELKKIFFVDKNGWIDMNDNNDDYKRIKGNLERHIRK